VSFPGYTLGETLHRGQRTIVCRATREADGRRVVLKYQSAEYPSLSEVLRYRHEFDLLRRLDGPHVIRALTLERFGNRIVLVTEDFGGVPLRDHFASRPPSLERFLEIAIGLVRALAFVHEQGVVHKDVNPTNALVEAQDAKHPEHVEGTFEYMSPEQTGRMNRTQDYRSDFYSLGATLYALAKGQPPFRSDDFLELIHCHIAKEPTPLHEEVPWVPETVSRIVGRLLAKSAENRYQSARGLLHDLEESLSRLRREGQVTPFPLGASDTSPRFEIPQVLYGRSEELTILLQAFERVVRERSELLLVGGYSGIGKSALVNEVHKPIALRRGYFLRGKFDQYGRDVPYSAIARALGEMVEHILLEPPESVERWRAEILEAVAANGRVVLDVVPSLELLLGPQPPLAPLPPAETKHRFEATLDAFVRALARPEHPLVLFLDDVQWADLPSLDLLESLLASGSTRSLLVIAAYRDNEVDASHPLLLAVQEIKKSQAAVHEIKLGPIGQEDAVSLVAATVRSSREEARPLAALLHQRSAGNPFFLLQLLRSLHEDCLFTLADGGRWTWDMQRILTLGLTEDAVALMASRLQRLPEPTKNLLRLASCIGTEFDLTLLSRASGSSLQRAAEGLWPALSEGLVLPVTEAYAAVHRAVSGGETEADVQATQRALDARVERAVSEGELRVAYRFLHDRVQQAAYAMIPPDLRTAEHLKLGRLLLGDGSTEPPEGRIFDIVPHLNIGLDLVTDAGERSRIARLNYRAGQRAKSSAAYRTAAWHFAVAMTLFGPDLWEADHDLALALHREGAECEFISGNLARSDQLAATAIERSRSLAEKAAIYCMRVLVHISQGKSFQKAAEIGFEGLRLFGHDIPETAEQRKTARDAELAKLQGLLSGRDIEALQDHPEMTDPHRRAAMELLVLTWGACFLGQDLVAASLVTYLVVTTSLEHGHAAASGSGYILYGLTVALGGDYPRGYRLGLLGMKLNERYPPSFITVRAGGYFMSTLNPYFNPLETNVRYYKKLQQIAPQIGETVYVMWAVLFMLYARTMKGDPLPEVLDESAKYLGFVKQSNHREVLLAFDTHRQMLRALQGKTKARNTLDEDGARSEAETLAEYEERRFHAARTLHGVFRTGMHVVFNDHRAALETARVIEGLLPFAIGMFPVTNHHFYQSLALAALLGDMDADEREKAEKLLDRNLEKLRGWAETAPSNFAHRRDLVAAEIARCRGDNDAAARLYDAALDGARNVGFLHDEAVAAETAARFYLGRGFQRIARLYLTDALYAYMRWGADAKVADLQERHGDLVLPEPFAADKRERSSSSTGKSSGTFAGAVDLASLMKAAQAISGEIEKQALVDQLMRITLENAGARRGWLVLEGKKGLTVIASTSVDSREGVRLSPTPLDAAQDLPATLVRYVVKTREPLVLHDATREGPFRSDPRLLARACKSVVAVPLVRQGRLTGVLYLENDLVEGAFTPERVEVLKLLAAQAAISLENASLYEDLEARVAERTTALAETNKKLHDSLSQLQGAQKQLGDASRRAGMAEIATSVLHNIGNVLNSVNVSSRIVIDSIKQSKAAGLSKVAQLVAEQPDLGAFFTSDERGKRLPEYLTRLAQALESEQASHLAELESLQKNIDHIKVIVSMQQAHAKFGGVVESLSLADLLDDAIRLNAAANDRRAVEVLRDFDALPAVESDRHKLFQIVMNLLSNARHAVQANDESGRRITVRLKKRDPVWVTIEVADNGSGITAENLVKIFHLGFTTKKDGHGFGLHSSSCAAIEMGGSLTAHSDGPGKGALFRLLLPLLGGGK
jgi:predicted ATPase/signal transduction histidine kinase